MIKKDIQQLIEKYIAGECSLEERNLLEDWYAKELQERLVQTHEEDYSPIKEVLWKTITDKRPELTKRRKAWLAWTGAAAVLLIGFYVGYRSLYISQDEGAFGVHELVHNSVVLPGGNKAILTTGDGKQFNLTDENAGIIDQSEGVVVRKDEDGIVSFELVKQTVATSSVINKIETPKGGVFQVVLPDGSKAWLNSASSISFPSVFSTKERLVAIQGEVYFEVQTDKKRPFRVQAPDQLIEVLGTKFNVNAYSDEPVTRTALLEGKVYVQGAETKQVLDPGFEFVTSKSGVDRVAKADLEGIIAWKEGVFQFDRIELEVLMRQLARWYDIEIIYKGDSPKDEFVGKIKRNEDIHKVLEVLRYGNIDVNLDGRRLMVGQKR